MFQQPKEPPKESKISSKDMLRIIQFLGGDNDDRKKATFSQTDPFEKKLPYKFVSSEYSTKIAALIPQGIKVFTKLAKEMKKDVGNTIVPTPKDPTVDRRSEAFSQCLSFTINNPDKFAEDLKLVMDEVRDKRAQAVRDCEEWLKLVNTEKKESEITSEQILQILNFLGNHYDAATKVTFSSKIPFTFQSDRPIPRLDIDHGFPLLLNDLGKLRKKINEHNKMESKKHGTGTIRSENTMEFSITNRAQFLKDLKPLLEKMRDEAQSKLNEVDELIKLFPSGPQIRPE